MSISVSRRIAFEALRRVETESAFASDLLHARLAAKQLRQEDSALATELTMGVLRWQRRLDYVIDKHLRRKNLDSSVRIALRMGAYQILFLDRIPAHAAVNESVELAKRAGARSATGLVNAVLRKLTPSKEKTGDLPSFPPKMPAVERLAIRTSHPTWLVERWLARWGEEETAALLASNNSPAPLSITYAGASSEEFGIDLSAGARAEPGKWLSSTLRLKGGHSAPLSLVEPLIAAGIFSFQDEASQMIALLLAVQPGETVLDLCCAPGGKTAIAARTVGRTGRVIAGDFHLHRLSSMRERLRQATAHPEPSPSPIGPSDLPDALRPIPRAPIDLIALDATNPLPFFDPFKRILVDAPCSGTGTLARNPEIRWRLTPQDLTDLAAKQRAILQNALAALAPGGRLVYSTCSLEPEENEQVVEAALEKASNCHIVDGRTALKPHLHTGADVNQLFDAKGYFRTFPQKHQTDGFFAAVIEKKQP